MKNQKEYEELSKKGKISEYVTDLIRQNRMYVEELRRDFIIKSTPKV